MTITRRDFLKLAAAATAAGHLSTVAFAKLQKVLRAPGGPRVVWLQGAGCDGCAVSFLNSIHFAGVDDLLLNTLDVRFQNNLMAATGELAVSAATGVLPEPGYILIVEGSIPTAAGGRYSYLWPEMTMLDGVISFAANAAYIIAIGACACYGGVTKGAPNPTGAQGVGDVIGADSRLINLPGCPMHPDWLVSTVTRLLTTGRVPPLDAHRRPLEFFGRLLHSDCPRRHKHCGEIQMASQLGEPGCLEFLGCKGKHTNAECPMRKWNSSGPGESGVNWCIGAGSPCIGCVNPNFPDGMSPFYQYLPPPRGLIERGDEEPAETPAPAHTGQAPASDAKKTRSAGGTR
jgi:hydrogenase small subunit